MRKILLTLGFSFLFTLVAMAQNITIKGRVTSGEDGQPISRASVKIKGGSKNGGGGYLLTPKESLHYPFRHSH